MSAETTMPEPEFVRLMDDAPRDGSMIVLHVSRDIRARGVWREGRWQLEEPLRMPAGGRMMFTTHLTDDECRCWSRP